MLTQLERREVLLLLQELLRDSSHMVLANDDPSGCATQYLVDHERLMANIAAKLEEGPPV